MTVWYDSNIVLIQSTMVNLLLALSILIPIRLGVFSFAGVGFYGIGAYTAVITNVRYGWSAPAAIAAGMAVAVAGGYVLGLMLRRLQGLYLGMATIAFDLILAVVAVNGGTVTGGAQGLFGAFAIIPMSALAGTTLLVLALTAVTERGRLGRRIEAVRKDVELAWSLGIDVRRARQASFVISAAVGALAGGINALLRTTVSPADVGFGLIVLALTIIIIGGTDSWWGALVGAIIFTWLPTILGFVGQWQQIVYGALVALAAVWVPGGLVGLSRRVGVWLRSRRRDANHALVPDVSKESRPGANDPARLTAGGSDD